MVDNSHKKSAAFLTVVLVLALALASATVSAAEVVARLDRTHLVQGETVTLILQTDDPQQSVEPSLSVLEKDFVVLDRRSETQMSIVNGNQTAVVRLMVTLEPLRAGELIIPPLRVGTQTTKPIAVTVDPPPDPKPGETAAVFIEVDLVPQDGPFYVHAQLGLTIRVFYQQNLTEAAISQPEPTQASVRLLDEVPFQAERNGQRYRVLERHYAVFPERSGEMTIPPLQLSGRLVERRSDRLWQPTVRGRRIRVESEPVTVAVLPRPPGFTGDSWQPARSYTLAQKISETDGMRVGEPVTRTIIIDAIGLEENMISEPQWPEMTGVRIYPDQPQGISRDDGAWVLGHKEFRYAVVPEQEGTLELPELSVKWWDTVADMERTSVLVASSVQVLPSALDALVPQPVAPAPSRQADAITGMAVGSGSAYWRWLTILFAILWLVTLVYAIRKRGTTEAPKAMAVKERAAEKELLNSFKRACNDGNATDARKCLQDWLSDYGPDLASRSILQFASVAAQAELRDELYALDAVGFRSVQEGSGEVTQWNGRALWQHFSTWHKKSALENEGQTPSPIDLYAPENRTA